MDTHSLPYFAQKQGKNNRNLGKKAEVKPKMGYIWEKMERFVPIFPIWGGLKGGSSVKRIQISKCS